MASDEQTFAGYNEEKFGNDNEIKQIIRTYVRGEMLGENVDEHIKEIMNKYKNSLHDHKGGKHAMNSEYSVIEWKKLAMQAQENNNEGLMRVMQAIIARVRIKNTLSSEKILRM